MIRRLGPNFARILALGMALGCKREIFVTPPPPPPPVIVPSITLSSTSLVFTATQGGASPASQLWFGERQVS